MLRDRATDELSSETNGFTREMMTTTKPDSAPRAATPLTAPPPPLPQDVLDGLLGEGAADLKTLPDKRRRSVRLPVRTHGTYAPLQGKQLAAPQRVRIKDVSLSGIGLLVDHKLAPGAFFVLQIPTDPQTPFLWFRSIRCKAAGPQMFLLGGEFIQIMERGQPGQQPGAVATAPSGANAAEMERIRHAILD